MKYLRRCELCESVNEACRIKKVLYTGIESVFENAKQKLHLNRSGQLATIIDSSSIWAQKFIIIFESFRKFA